MRLGIAAAGLVLTTTVGLAGVSVPSSASGPPAAAVVGTSGGPERAGRVQVRRTVLKLVNKRRDHRGCDPVRMSRPLVRAAQRHTNRMADAGDLSHQLPGEASPGVRMRNAGYRWTKYGENIAVGYATPRSVMRAWMNSSGHRRNILDCDFEHLGVGVASGHGRRWWTQDFGRN